MGGPFMLTTVLAKASGAEGRALRTIRALLLWKDREGLDGENNRAWPLLCPAH
jgi:hypothetical protein